MAETDASIYSGAGGPTLVLQHGFASSSATWDPMQLWLGYSTTVNGIVRKSLPWRETYETQAAALHQRLRTQDYIPGPVLLIGHSNGGMISRYLGRNPDAYNQTNSPYGYAPLTVNGVITVGTPHKGAPLARYVHDLNNFFGFGGYPAKLLCPIFGLSGCARFGELAGSSIHSYVGHMAKPVAVLDEMQPNSAYHEGFNAQPETFQRYGVQSYIWKRWMVWRLNGDMKCLPEDRTCGGGAEATKTDKIYHRNISCAVVGIFIARWSKAARCGLDAAFLKGADLLATRFIASDGDETDGVVPRWSQLYPNIPMSDQYQIYDGPSHLGETKSTLVRTELERILFERFRLPVRGR